MAERRELMRSCFTVRAALAYHSLARERGDVVLRGSLWRIQHLEIATSHLMKIMSGDMNFAYTELGMLSCEQILCEVGMCSIKPRHVS
jgi:hypothetical protein